MSDIQDGREISLQDILDSLRHSRWIIVWIMALCIAVSAGIVVLVPNKYAASTVLSVVSHDGNGGLPGELGALTSQFGGIGELAGILPRSDLNRASIVATLQSESLTELYLKTNDLLPVLFPSEWDSTLQTWRHIGTRETPSLWKGNWLFQKKIMSVTVDDRTGLVTLTINWKNPLTAATWANGIVKLTNGYLRDKAIHESDTNISYLNEQASKTDVLGVKQAIYGLLKNEISKEMVARGSDEYALKVIDPAFPPERPVSPKPILWLAIGSFCGLLLSFVVALARYQLTRGERPPKTGHPSK